MTVGMKLEVVGDARKLDQIFMFDKTLFKK